MTEGLFDSENFQKLKIASSLIPNYLTKKMQLQGLFEFLIFNKEKLEPKIIRKVKYVPNTAFHLLHHLYQSFDDTPIRGLES